MNQYSLLNAYGGATYSKVAEKESEKAIAMAADYRSYDWLKGFTYSSTHLEKDMFATDFRELQELKIPVYFFLGRHDWNVPAVLAESMFQKLNAPYKEIIWFENSGHGIPEEEPGFFNKILLEKFQ